MILKINPDNTVEIVTLPPNVTEEQFIQSNPGYIVVESVPSQVLPLYLDSNGSPQIDVERSKEFLIDYASNLLKDYIETYYPEIKQRSDMVDKEYHASALMLLNDTYTTDYLYKQAAIDANAMLDNQTPLSEVLTKYPEEEQYHWNQLIKVALRVAWVRRNKYILSDYIAQVNNASTVDEIQTLLNSIPEWIPYPDNLLDV